MAVTDDAILRVKEMIVSGELKPGDRLPREADLAERLGLSRNSLREAVKALSLVRVLDVRQGDGTYVSSLRADDLLGALSFVLELHRGDESVLEVLQVRRILEPAAAAMAAQRIQPEEIDALLALCQSAESAGSVEELVEHDLEFHRGIAHASGNSYLARLLDTLAGPTVRVRIWRGITQASAVERTVAEHRAIVSALAAHQPELARSWSTVHVAGVEQWLSDLA
ncbi:FadR/GntR family transcriptional regulator [Goodfellowiella coeruleoviolacea]|uniref:GntR family transcriptional regulator, transcriptional repressor for pyruvate dehydrogenase complex n=1 Tax=Goodfellowiella coeruleoviolacea TaxID=334858 RepID=A0AAE3KFB6_9PSEU|nr:FadR/GntR family transcriptional regulator [Goodfellowiella coeruleoviolacea]MCP2164780.1 GntR family transcriptional regulator, transcriptional repressor for pyruvate dehydrogenase complex [Goodfellowiella coeruleoviolacea]